MNRADTDIVIGYLTTGDSGHRYFMCPKCVRPILEKIESDPTKGFPNPTRVYKSNIGCYSQDCHMCKSLLVVGAKKMGSDEYLMLFEVTLGNKINLPDPSDEPYASCEVCIAMRASDEQFYEKDIRGYHDSKLTLDDFSPRERAEIMNILIEIDGGN